MWKYVWLLGGLGGLIVSLLVTWGYPEDVRDLNLIIYSGEDVYRYNVATDRLHFLRRQPARAEFNDLHDVSMRPSPNGQWTAITYTADPDRVYVIDTMSGDLVQTIELVLDDSNNYFGQWSPDSRQIGWITYNGRQAQTYVETLDVLTGKVRRFPLSSEFFPGGRWRDNDTVEIWSASQFGSYHIDIFSGNTTFEDHVPPATVNDCCSYAYSSEEGIHVYERHRHKLVLSTDALEAQATPDFQKIAYLQAAGTEAAHVFVYDRETSSNRQIPFAALHVSANCVKQSVTCLAFGPWSPDSEWIVFREDGTTKVLNVTTGKTQTVIDQIATTSWSSNSLSHSRDDFPLWLAVSAGLLMFGLRRMVR